MLRFRISLRLALGRDLQFLMQLLLINCILLNEFITEIVKLSGTHYIFPQADFDEND